MLKPDGVATQWFEALSTLMAYFFQKTSNADIDVAPVMEYVIKKMLAGSSSHMLLFTKVVERISGIESFGQTITDAQLDALGGSHTLQFLAIHSDSKGPSRKSMVRQCVKTMFEKEQIMPLFILMSHIKERLSSGHLDDELESRYPVISDLVDRVNNAFVQLFNFLEFSENVCTKTESLAPILPSFAELVLDYGMSHEFAFHICRAHFGDIRISAHPKLKVDSKADPFTTLEKTCEILLDKDTLHSLTPSFYACFWAYRLRDIYVPMLQYSEHGKKLQKQIDDLKKKKEDNATKKEIKRLEGDLETLQTNQKEQSKTYRAIVQGILRPKSQNWLKKVQRPENTISSILFKCVLPRLCVSDVDARYCSHFILFLTNESTPGFEILTFVWTIIQNFHQILSSLTNAETRRFGRFFCSLLHGVEQWRADDGKFRAFIKTTASKVPKDSILPEVKTKADLCSILRLFRKLLTQQMILTLQNDDPRLQKNTVIFLHNMISQYPKIQSCHKALSKAISDLDLLKDSPMDLLVKRVKVILDKGFSACDSEAKYGGVDLLADLKKRTVQVKKEKTAKPTNKAEMDNLLQQRLKLAKKKTEKVKVEAEIKLPKKRSKNGDKKNKKQKTGESDWR